MKWFGNKPKISEVDFNAKLEKKENQYREWLQIHPLPLPSEEQVKWLESEIGMFCHFGINTFHNKEWSDGTLSPTTFNPKKVECEQWVKVAQDLGANYMILTAKHHDGFCLWPTATTDYSIKNSPYMEGQGDIVKEFLDACKKYNMKAGLYLSPWDRHEPSYSDNEKYNVFYIQQLTELLTNYDMELFEIWFDGAGSKGHIYDWDSIMAVCQKFHPKAMIFNMGQPTIRWVGNESGLAKEANWNVIQASKSNETHQMETIDDNTRNLGLKIKENDGIGNLWMPAECDTPIRRRHWFYHTHDKRNLKSLKKLINIYLKSVGRGANLLLNLSPNREGRIEESDAIRAKELGDEIGRRYNTPINKTSGSGTELILDLGKLQKINAVITQENIRQGQKIRRYMLEFEQNGSWKKIYQSYSIGHKKIDEFPTIIAQRLRLKILFAFGKPEVVNFAAFYY